jgi:biopolymer transport protein ExbD
VLGQCVQLEVTIGDGFEIDGQPVSRGELAEKLLGAYEARNREVAVDVRCEEGVKVAALRELHDAMLAHGLHRIQYFGHSGEPVPYVLPAPQMTDRLADLPAEAISRLRVGPDGLNLDGRDVTREALGPAVHARLAENPSVVVIVESEADVAYADFVAVLGEVTAAGAERLAIEIPSGVEG